VDPVKEWDKARPFVRITPPSENGGPGSKGATRQSGEGHDQNDPLGIIDPNRGTVAENQKNPRKVSDVLKEKGEGNEDEIELVATATAEVGDSAELY
jgi:hypothetical protein